jgi:hypothetical protein
MAFIYAKDQNRFTELSQSVNLNSDLQILNKIRKIILVLVWSVK